MIRRALLQSLSPALGAIAGAVVGAFALDVTGAAIGAALGAAAAVLVTGRGAEGEKDQPAAKPESAARDGELPAGYGRYLLDQVPVGILLIDRRGRVQFTNPTAVQLFGRRPPGPFHMSALRAPRLLDAIEAALRSGEPCSVTFGLARAGGTHMRATIQALAQPTPPPASRPEPEDAPALLVMIEDDTEPRRAAELHRDFVANASHELKTPLASISGIIETLTGHARDDPEATERFLALMAAQVERMKRLVQDLLSLNRIELNERIRPEEPQNIRQIVWDAAQVLEPMAAANAITLACDPPAEHPEVLGDRQELTQLFSNLIDNAIKYGRPGTEVRVRARGAADGSRVGIAVIDHGPGIAREHLPRLTERFYRVSPGHSRVKGGTGLGLAIVKHIVNRHQGELKIESTPGQGSTFTVWLPVAELRAPVAEIAMGERRSA